jgi:hypothetical protein
MLKVRTFGNQDNARTNIAELTARAVEDVLYILDSATGPEGSDNIDPAPSPEVSRAYKEFREWFGPQVGAAIQALVVGPLLSRLSVGDDGRAYIDSEDVKRYEPGIDRLQCRCIWLAEEIPSLVDAYGELGQEEATEACSLAQSVYDYDFESPDDREVLRGMLPELERWYMFANPGAKILRGDKDAVAALIESTRKLKERLGELDESRESALSQFEDTGTVGDEDEIQRELHRTEAKIVKLEDKLSKLDRRRLLLSESLANV